MGERILVRVIGATSGETLRIETCARGAGPDGQVRLVCGVPGAIPLSLVPEDLRLPNSEFYVVLSEPWTVSAVERERS